MPLRRLTPLLLLLLCLYAAAPLAIPPDDGNARVVLEQLQAQVDEPADPAQLLRVRRELGGLIAQIDADIARQEAGKAALQARIAEVDPGQFSTVGDVARQRESLQAAMAGIDSEIARARADAADARALDQDIGRLRLQAFRRDIGERTATPLLPRFWREFVARQPDDWRQFGKLAGEFGRGLRHAFAAAHAMPTAAGLGLAALLLLGGRRIADAVLVRLAARPDRGLPPSLMAVLIVLVSTLVPGVAAHLAWMALDWHGNFGPATSAVAGQAIALVWLAGLMVGLGRALLAPDRPSWRLLPLGDATAKAVRMMPLLLALVIALDGIWAAVCDAAGMSRSVFGAGAGALTASGALLVIMAVRRFGQRQQHDAAVPAPAFHGSRLILAIAAVAAMVTLLAVASGYIMFARLVIRQLIWALAIGALFFLVMRLVDDMARLGLAALRQHAGSGQAEQRWMEQGSIIVSAALRVLAALFAIDLLLAPLGASPLALIDQWRRLGSGFAIGEIRIAPATLLQGMVVLAVGSWLVRLLQRWLSAQLLPATDMDPGIRASVTTLTGYVGSIVVIGFVMAALGISVERIAWVASALSVGIGFGLQAIVQNFVSGVILLVERPVKVGDRIALGDSEGDIRRINVRSTELRLADRSTLLVPNSQLITQAVRNVTPQHAQSRVRFSLPVVGSADVDRVRTVLQGVLAAHSGVLQRPAPSVLLDSVDGGKIVFMINAYTDTPRLSAVVRSDLLVASLAALQAEGVALA